MQEQTQNDLRDIQTELWKVHAAIGKAMDSAGGPGTVEWQALYGLMSGIGSLSTTVTVYLGNHGPIHNQPPF